ncbi:MAG TPA: HEAT repeat domain-containing protein [Pirellulales bacterium]|jgi:HEAT repeat protein
MIPKQSLRPSYPACGLAQAVAHGLGLTGWSLAARQPSAVAVLATVTIAAALTSAGCGQIAAVKEKPTTDEIRQIQATVEAQKPALDATPSITQQAIYRPWGVKETAVDALGRIGESAVPTLITALSDANPRVRAQAGRALARMGAAGKDAVPTLMERLDDPDEDVRQAAARALGQMGPFAAPAVPALVGMIESPDGKAPASTIPPLVPQPGAARQ